LSFVNSHKSSPLSLLLLYLVLAQDAIQAALKDYKSKNDGEEGGEAQSSAI